jgi:serralysin
MQWARESRTMSHDTSSATENSTGGTDPAFYLNAIDRGGVAGNAKPSLTTTQAAEALTRHGFAWGALGQPTTVTYAFRATGALDKDVTDGGAFARFNPQQIAQAELALRAWADVAAITFTRVGVGTSGPAAFSDNASILFGNYVGAANGSSGFAYYPGRRDPGAPEGDVWMNSGIPSVSQPQTGGFGRYALTHEIGHAIGLAHPGSYDASDAAQISYAKNAAYYEDTDQYTVMSYWSETNTGAAYGSRFASGPQLDDIAALQRLYGVNTTTRTGATTYGFNGNSGREEFSAADSGSKLIFAVWDAGGTDTFDFSGFGENQTIDLREGHFSDVGALRGNVSIARGAVIENGKGGSGHDKITGNLWANELTGGAGNDTLDGGAGNDTLIGGAGNDLLSGGLGVDMAVFGVDIVNATASFAGGRMVLDSAEGRDEVSGIEVFRFANRTFDRRSDPTPLVDDLFYLLRYKDIAQAGVDPNLHYAQFGFREGRDPNAFFDTAGYLRTYADVRAAGVNPLEHYAQFGFREGRDPSASFDASDYLNAHRDVAAAGVDPLKHYLQHGESKGGGFSTMGFLGERVAPARRSRNPQMLTSAGNAPILGQDPNPWSVSMFLFRKKSELPRPGEALPGRPTPVATAERHFISGRPVQGPYPEGMKTAVFGLGCFWGAERMFWKLPGVWVTAVGYAAGQTPNPTYEEVCSGMTGHNEVVLVVYDPAGDGYNTLLRTFWEGHNPTQGMRQGNDSGTQYRSGIYVADPDQREAALESKRVFGEALKARGFGPITTEIVEPGPFYFAEDYHQQYLAKNPGGYCGIGGTGVSCPIGVGLAA